MLFTITTLLLTSTSLALPNSMPPISARQVDKANAITGVEVFSSPGSSFIKFHYSDKSLQTAQESDCSRSVSGGESIIDETATSDAFSDYFDCDGGLAAFSYRRDGVIWIRTQYQEPSGNPQIPPFTCTYRVAYTATLQTVSDSPSGLSQVDVGPAGPNGNVTAIC